MAKALQCPSCGTTTRVDAPPPGGTLQCPSCGQPMKVPPGFAGRSSRRSDAGSPPVAPAAASTADPPVRTPSSGTVAPPTPSRPSRPVATAGSATAGVAGGTAVLAPGAAPVVPLQPLPPQGRAARRGARPAGGGAADGRDTLPLWARIAIWVVALPLGLAIVGIPARQLGYLTSQKLLDVIVKRDLSRFVPIVVIVALWALVSAVLVTALVEGGRMLLRRHAAQSRSRSEAALGGGLDAAVNSRPDGAGAGRGRRIFGRK